jgi:hypothetical protein
VIFPTGGIMDTLTINQTTRYTSEDQKIETSIITLVEEHPQGIKINEVINNIGGKYDIFTTKEALWHLINTGRINLTIDRKITPVSN